VFSVTRSGQTSATTTVHWSLIGGLSNSTNAADFASGTAFSGNLTFAPGETLQTITANVRGDTLAEQNENFRVVLGGATAGVAITNAVANAVILNDDTSLAISANTVSHAEGDSGSTPFVFSVTRSGQTSATTTVHWSLIGGLSNSTNAADFAPGTAFSGNLTFAPGETLQTITVNVQGDTLAEQDENFRVVLGGATAGVAVTNTTANALIISDDNTEFSIAPTDAVKPEGDSGPTPFTFTVTEAGDTSGTHVLHWVTTGLSPNSANPGDFVGAVVPSGDVTFLPGQTSQLITVNVQGDLAAEADEHFRVVLQSVTGGGSITKPIAAATIQNDDSSPALSASLTQVAAADFNGDGVGDLLRQSAAGNLFLLDGAQAVMTALSRPAAGMSFVAAGDLDGDARADILLRDGAGGLHDWTMNGANVVSDDLITTLSAGTTVLQLADMTGDGRADILLHDTAPGAVSPYTLLAMDGPHILSSAGSATLPDAWRA
jgi:orotate phosphoribosyltransferase-like protein